MAIGPLSWYKETLRFLADNLLATREVSSEIDRALSSPGRLSFDAATDLYVLPFKLLFATTPLVAVLVCGCSGLRAICSVCVVPGFACLSVCLLVRAWLCVRGCALCVRLDACLRASYRRYRRVGSIGMRLGPSFPAQRLLQAVQEALQWQSRAQAILCGSEGKPGKKKGALASVGMSCARSVVPALGCCDCPHPPPPPVPSTAATLPCGMLALAADWAGKRHLDSGDGAGAAGAGTPGGASQKRGLKKRDRSAMTGGGADVSFAESNDADQEPLEEGELQHGYVQYCVVVTSGKTHRTGQAPCSLHVVVRARGALCRW